MSDDDVANVETFEIDDLEFKDTGSQEDIKSRLLATVCILGVEHHLEAVAIVETDGKQIASDSAFQRYLDDLENAFCTVGKLRTVKIAGRQYALFMSPHCQ